MNNRMITKIAGIVCSAALMAMPGIAAFAQTDLPVEERKDIIADIMNFVGGEVAAEAEEIVMFPIYIQNNSGDGFTSVHLRLLLAEGLVPAFKADGTPIVKKGIGADDDDVKLSASYDADAGWINLEISSTTPITETGIMARVAISLPEEVRDTYAVRLEIDRNAEKDLPDCAALNGTIYTAVQTEPATEPPVTETAAATAATTVTTMTTTTTAPVTAALTLTTPTFSATNPLAALTVPERTTKAVQAVGYGGAAGAAAVNYHSANAVDPLAIPAGGDETDGSGTTTETAALIGYDETQSESGSTETTAEREKPENGIVSAQTGDIGIGIAVTGLLLAAGTTVVTVIRKRK